jgi:hypothetical protein
MANWATMFRQRTRLPVAVDPRAELFRCVRLDATLARTACANRHRLAQGSTSEGISDQAVTYGTCRDCPIGAAHAQGKPTPRELRQEIRTAMTIEHVIDEQDAPARAYPERQCGRGRHTFKPKGAYERACSDESCRDKYGPAELRPARRLNTPAVPDQVAAPERAVEVEPPAACGVGMRVSPAELLQLAGFQVVLVQVPSGSLLLVTG